MRPNPFRPVLLVPLLLPLMVWALWECASLARARLALRQLHRAHRQHDIETV